MEGWEERGGGSVLQLSRPRAAPHPDKLFPTGLHGNTHTFPSCLCLCLTPWSSVLSGAWVLQADPQGLPRPLITPKATLHPHRRPIS